MQFLLVEDEKVSRFVYWDDGVRNGMSYADELYEHVSSFGTEKRLNAYALSDELQESGSSVCLTVGQGKYSVWKTLRSQAPGGLAEKAC